MGAKIRNELQPKDLSSLVNDLGLRLLERLDGPGRWVVDAQELIFTHQFGSIRLGLETRDMGAAEITVRINADGESIRASKEFRSFLRIVTGQEDHPFAVITYRALDALKTRDKLIEIARRGNEALNRLADLGEKVRSREFSHWRKLPFALNEGYWMVDKEGFRYTIWNERAHKFTDKRIFRASVDAYYPAWDKNPGHPLPKLPESLSEELAPKAPQVEGRAISKLAALILRNGLFKE